jgi:hypothetical protein
MFREVGEIFCTAGLATLLLGLLILGLNWLGQRGSLPFAGRAAVAAAVCLTVLGWIFFAASILPRTANFASTLKKVADIFSNFGLVSLLMGLLILGQEWLRRLWSLPSAEWTLIYAAVCLMVLGWIFLGAGKARRS